MKRFVFAASALTAAFFLAACGGGSPSRNALWDIDKNGIPAFVKNDFTKLADIAQISRFRSGYGHDYSDATENCRSMKHYYAPYERYLDNGTVPVYSPVDGKIVSVTDEGHGSAEGTTNKQIRIRPDAYPAFTFVIFHTDLSGDNIRAGTKVNAGELLGYARLRYPDLGETAHDFDIAVWVDTPGGVRYVSWFETMSDTLFETYRSRGAASRSDFIISRAERDADPLVCDGSRFENGGTLPDWVTLTLPLVDFF